MKKEFVELISHIEKYTKDKKLEIGSGMTNLQRLLTDSVLEGREIERIIVIESVDDLRFPTKKKQN